MRKGTGASAGAGGWVGGGAADVANSRTAGRHVSDVVYAIRTVVAPTKW